MNADTHTVPHAEVSLRSKRHLIMAAVMAAMFIGALEGTVVGTAAPSIVREFGDLGNYSWVFSGYLLSQTVTAMSFGRLADVAGRKTAIVLGLAIFAIGSLACGFAWSMPSLIAFRIVQGIGAGAIMPVCMTIIGDLYPPSERGKAQSLVATVFGTSSVIGPIVGGLIVESARWSWIFWINVPVGLFAIAGFSILLPARPTHGGQKFDAAGNLCLTGTLGAGLSALTFFSSGNSLMGTAAGVAATLCAILLLRAERRSEAPIFSGAIWRNPNIAISNLATLLGAMSIIGLTAFLPLFMQAVLKSPPIVAGMALTAIALGWPLGATFAGWYQLRLGLLRTMQIGCGLIVSGTLAFVTLDAASGFLHAAAGSFLMGGGMGLLTSAALLIVQEAVPPKIRGSATSTNVFSRNLGSVLGAAAFGAIFNAALRTGAKGMQLHDLEKQLSSGGALALSPAASAQLASGLHWVFLSVALTALAALAVVGLTRKLDG